MVTEEPQVQIDRQALIDRLLWGSGGMSWGVCPIGALFAAIAVRTELKSAVTVMVPQDRYTDEDLVQLVAFSDAQTERHKRSVGCVLHGDNIACVSKDSNGSWYTKKLTWDSGYRFQTFEELLTFFRDVVNK